MLATKVAKKPPEKFFPHEVMHPGCYIYDTFVKPNNLTIAEASRRLGISPDSAERLFTGRHELWKATARKAETLGWSTCDDLMTMQLLYSLYSRSAI